MPQTVKIHFTKRALADIAPPDQGRVYQYDAKAPGLAICVTEVGTRTFYFVKKLDGRTIRVRIGKFPDLSVENARDTAKKLTVAVANGENPQVAKRAKATETTLGELWTYWMDTHAGPHKKSASTDQQRWNAYLSHWSNRRLSSIQQADVRSLHLRMKATPYVANRAVSLLRAMYNIASELGYKGENPARGIRKYKEESRDRFLMPDELPAFFQALDSEPNPLMRTFFVVALFSGARRGNVCAMRWDQIDLTQSTWRIPDTKRGEPQVVPLLPAALDALLAIRDKAVDGWVFPARNRRGHDCPHLTDPMPAWRRLLKRAGLSGLRIHDLRRTAGSYMAITGTALQIIGKALGHTQQQTTAIYSRLTNESVRQAMERGADAMVTASKVKLLESGATPNTEGSDNGKTQN